MTAISVVHHVNHSGISRYKATTGGRSPHRLGALAHYLPGLLLMLAAIVTIVWAELGASHSIFWEVIAGLLALIARFGTRSIERSSPHLLVAGTELLKGDGHDLAVTLSSDPGALVRRNRSPYWVAVTGSQKSQWRSAEYCASVKVDRPGRSWISQAGVSALAV